MASKFLPADNFINWISDEIDKSWRLSIERCKIDKVNMTIETQWYCFGFDCILDFVDELFL